MRKILFFSLLFILLTVGGILFSTKVGAELYQGLTESQILLKYAVMQQYGTYAERLMFFTGACFSHNVNGVRTCYSAVNYGGSEYIGKYGMIDRESYQKKYNNPSQMSPNGCKTVPGLTYYEITANTDYCYDIANPITTPSVSRVYYSRPTYIPPPKVYVTPSAPSIDSSIGGCNYSLSQPTINITWSINESEKDIVKSFEVRDSTNSGKLQTVSVGNNVNGVFNFSEKVGAENYDFGYYIYALNEVGTKSAAAFVTVRSGSSCGTAKTACVAKVNFSRSLGYNPYTPLLLKGGKFYGTTMNGGDKLGGVLYEWNPVGNVYT
ncbi:MAG: hypothetical protein WCO30_02480, partial [bacterium]